jgi:hypothetical protein
MATFMTWAVLKQQMPDGLAGHNRSAEDLAKVAVDSRETDRVPPVRVACQGCSVAEALDEYLALTEKQSALCLSGSFVEQANGRLAVQAMR